MTTDTSQTRLSHIAEVTEGTTPATPAFTNIRFTSESLAANIANVSSNEIRADRNISDLEQVGQSAGGSVNFELSYGGFMDDWIAAALCSAWSTNVAKTGVTRSPFTLEKFFEAGATDQYHRITGALIDTFGLSIRANQIVTGSASFRGRTQTSAQTAIASSTYTAVNTNPIINAANNFANLTMTGVSSPQIVALDLNINNNLRQQPVVGSVAAKGVGLGSQIVTGTLEAYFEDQAMYELFLAGTAANLSFDLGGASTKKYSFSAGNIKFTDGKVLIGGKDQDVMAQMSFQALYYASDAATLKVTRTP